MATQVGALAQLLDRLPEPDRELALDAVSGPGFRARIAPQPRDGRDEAPAAAGACALLERPHRAQGEDDPREVTVVLDTAFGGRWWIPMMLSWPARELRMTVGGCRWPLPAGARPGGTDRAAFRRSRRPRGRSCWASRWRSPRSSRVRRETRPISELSAALDRLGTSLEPSVWSPARAGRAAAGGDLRRHAARIVELVRNRSLVLGA